MLQGQDAENTLKAARPKVKEVCTSEREEEPYSVSRCSSSGPVATASPCSIKTWVMSFPKDLNVAFDIVPG